MDYVAGYRCPRCGGKFQEETFENQKRVKVACLPFGCGWKGTLEEAEKLNDVGFYLEMWFEKNEQRFHDCQFSDIEIAHSAFLEGIIYQVVKE